VTKTHPKPHQWRKSPLTFIPLKAGALRFCFAEPAFSPATWPIGGTWPSQSVLLDLDPWSIRSKGIDPELPSSRIAEHRWPSDTIDLARGMGLDVSVDSKGIPWVGPDAVADRANVYLHDLTLGFVDVAKESPSAAEWQGFREKLHGVHLKEVQLLPAGCRAIHYFTEGDMSFLLTSSVAMVEEWIDSLLFTEFPNLATTTDKLGLTPTPLAAWILKNSEGRGLRVDAVEVRADQYGTHTVGMRGRWGKDPTSLAVSIGSLEPNGSFEQSFVVS
jgi:hypothetical protein